MSPALSLAESQSPGSICQIVKRAFLDFWWESPQGPGRLWKSSPSHPRVWHSHRAHRSISRDHPASPVTCLQVWCSGPCRQRLWGEEGERCLGSGGAAPCRVGSIASCHCLAVSAQVTPPLPWRIVRNHPVRRGHRAGSCLCAVCLSVWDGSGPWWLGLREFNLTQKISKNFCFWLYRW